MDDLRDLSCVRGLSDKQYQGFAGRLRKEYEAGSVGGVVAVCGEIIKAHRAAGASWEGAVEDCPWIEDLSEAERRIPLGEFVLGLSRPTHIRRWAARGIATPEDLAAEKEL